jgi:molybdenum cofactor cytidylyltransferase
MKLKQAIRAESFAAVALVGAGGKTTALFQLARQFESRVLVSTSTHLAVDQVFLADKQIILNERSLPDNFRDQLNANIILITGHTGSDDRVQGLSTNQLQALYEFALHEQISLLVEADGSKRLPLKAPAEHEPAIPPWANIVVVCAGLQGLGKPLTHEYIHRPEIFARISGAVIGESVSTAHISAVLKSREGGLKNIPAHARKIAVINQADSPELQTQAQVLAKNLLPDYDSALVASLNNPALEVMSVHEQTAGIILAAGGSVRFGQPKILLDWQGVPFIRREAETALAAGLSPVIVVLGAVIDPAIEALRGLPVQLMINNNWRDGQGYSVRSGITALPSTSGGAVFLLGDQPQVTEEVLAALIEEHQRSLASIVAPQVKGQRANPVLFDRVTFPDLLQLEGDTGGRSLFSRYPVKLLDWADERLTMDVDTMDDYQSLLEA